MQREGTGETLALKPLADIPVAAHRQTPTPAADSDVGMCVLEIASQRYSLPVPHSRTLHLDVGNTRWTAR
eukprot:353873-Rhodomonas_salina.1